MEILVPNTAMSIGKQKHLLSITKMHTDLNISLNKTVSTFPTKLSSTLKAIFWQEKYIFNTSVVI